MSEPTLKELLRAHADELPALDLDPVKKVFEADEMPSVDESEVGRIRLHRALLKKYGPDYRSNPKVKEALDHYNKEVKFLKHYKRILGARYGE